MFYSARFHGTEPQLLSFLMCLYFLFLLSPTASESMWSPLVLPYLRHAFDQTLLTKDFDQIG